VEVVAAEGGRRGAPLLTGFLSSRKGGGRAFPSFQSPPSEKGRKMAFFSHFFTTFHFPFIEEEGKEKKGKGKEVTAHPA